jgi:sterol desaturase/sphingolipid hydroxylase (fatty acid hydroxylase superfamily)
MQRVMIELPYGFDVGKPNGAFLALTLIFIAAEYLYARLSHHDEDHDIKETAASVGVAIGDLAARTLTGAIAAVPFLWLYQHRLIDIPLNIVWGLLALFLGVEFCYYWFHRASHRVRWLWATHSVHHSATHFNLSAAIRLGWTGQLTGAFVFFLPLAWLGFHPLAIGATLALGLLYQFFLHTSFDVSLGPLEWVLNTPAHHRVHHASNEGCLDRNYGSTLIIWDRLFGTFAKAPAVEPLRYGLKGREGTVNVFRIALGEWVHLFRDVARTKGWRRRLQVILGPP